MIGKTILIGSIQRLIHHRIFPLHAKVEKSVVAFIAHGLKCVDRMGGTKARNLNPVRNGFKFERCVFIALIVRVQQRKIPPAEAEENREAHHEKQHHF